MGDVLLEAKEDDEGWDEDDPATDSECGSEKPGGQAQSYKPDDFHHPMAILTATMTSTIENMRRSKSAGIKCKIRVPSAAPATAPIVMTAAARQSTEPSPAKVRSAAPAEATIVATAADVSRPEAGAAIDQVYQVVRLRDRAFATSGDYRIFFDQDGKRFSHVLDPRTGRPVANGVVSVSVTAATCARADSLATALMVMGVDEGLKLVDALADVECLMVVRDTEGNLVDHYSKNFKRYTAEAGQ